MEDIAHQEHLQSDDCEKLQWRKNLLKLDNFSLSSQLGSPSSQYTLIGNRMDDPNKPPHRRQELGDDNAAAVAANQQKQRTAATGPFKSNSYSRFDCDFTTDDLLLRKQDIDTGDILFFHGEDPESRVIEISTNSMWSHVGMTVELFESTIQTLKDFRTFLPYNWKSIAKEISKTSSLCEDIKKCRLSSTPITRVKTQQHHHNDNEDENGGSANNNDDDGDDDCIGGTNTFDTSSRLKHVAEVLVIYMLLKNNKHIQKAINDEYTYLSKMISLKHGILSSTAPSTTTSNNETPRGEGRKHEMYIVSDQVIKREREVILSGRKRYMCLFESTTSTDESARCLLTDNTDVGVKLTNLETRAAGYKGKVGIRKTKIRTFMDSYIKSVNSEENGGGGDDDDDDDYDDDDGYDYDESDATFRGLGRKKKYVDLYLQNQLYALFCNMIINVGKPYEKDYSEMWNAWAYSGFCCSDPSNPGPCRAMGWCLFKLFCCEYCCCCNPQRNKHENDKQSSLENDSMGSEYHKADEYSSLYCSELVMQILHDFMIVTELKKYQTVTDVKVVNLTTSTTSAKSRTNNDKKKSGEITRQHNNHSSVRPSSIKLFELICHPYDNQREDPSLNKSTSNLPYYYVNKDWVKTKLNVFTLIDSNTMTRTVSSDNILQESYYSAELIHKWDVSMMDELKSSSSAGVKSIVNNNKDDDNEYDLDRDYSLLGRTAVTPCYLAKTPILPVPFRIAKTRHYKSMYTAFIE